MPEARRLAPHLARKRAAVIAGHTGDSYVVSGARAGHHSGVGASSPPQGYVSIGEAGDRLTEDHGEVNRQRRRRRQVEPWIERIGKSGRPIKTCEAHLDLVQIQRLNRQFGRQIEAQVHFAADCHVTQYERATRLDSQDAELGRARVPLLRDFMP